MENAPNTIVLTPGDRFSDMIAPKNLLGLVRNTAGFIFEFPQVPTLVEPAQLTRCGRGHRAFIPILERADSLEFSEPPTDNDLQNYFAICLAAHHATVATFIPTDVDSKIRGLLWNWRRPSEVFRQMFEFSLEAMEWEIYRVSTRYTERAGVGPVSGHNGEMLGVLAGALGCFVRMGDIEYADRAACAIDEELRREITEFEFVKKQRGGELDLLRVAMSIMHNLGDLDQGISFWGRGSSFEPFRERFAELGKDPRRRYGTTFHLAGQLYRTLLASEGHRHYPLRHVPALRRNNNHLLPLGPWFDEWGFAIGAATDLSTPEKGEVLTALLSGCKKIPGQHGYFRAIAGIYEGFQGRIDDLLKSIPVSARHQCREAAIRQAIATRRESFESSYRKRTRAMCDATS